MKKPVKICKNPECRDDILDYKSAKRNYCNDSCRNRAGYLNRLKVNNNFILIDKELKKNKKLLMLFILKNIFKIPFDIILQLGFNENYLLKGNYYDIANIKKYLFKLDNILFEYNKEENLIVIHEY